MRGSIIIRTEHDCAGLSPARRTAIVTQKVRSLSDEDLKDLARRREKQHPGRHLRPMSITLPADVLERLQCFQGSRWSVSALIDRILESEDTRPVSSRSSR
ncbi:hypothetical protein HER14_19305 [Acidithiobacillus thiooxidans]|uniref:hypothetical protein n=1 Tax=Acidithiobacillus thiooxidans TaxID=930 RepID=UPI001C0691B2|nr:hypothetical protein [Acidithiobacillus thiooxidans]MBU2753013.1 hypothetical protein [Acidithiobacillus thiooxidans]